MHLYWYNRGSGSLHPIAERAVAGPDLWHGTCIPVKAPVREAGLHDLVPCGSDGSAVLPAVSLAFLLHKKKFCVVEARGAR